MASTTVQNWEFKEKHVEEDLTKNSFLSSESVVLCVIPYKTGSTTEWNDSPTSWIPVGVVENMSLQQRKQINEVYELGSKRPYHIPGKTFKRLSFSRILFNGRSLMRAITQAEGSADNGGTWDSPGGTAASEFYINLASSYFDRPLNLGIVMQDQGNNADTVDLDGDGVAYSATGLIGCYVESHNLSFAAQQTVIMENASMTVKDIIAVPYGQDVTE